MSLLFDCEAVLLHHLDLDSDTGPCHHLRLTFALNFWRHQGEVLQSRHTSCGRISSLTYQCFTISDITTMSFAWLHTHLHRISFRPSSNSFSILTEEIFKNRLEPSSVETLILNLNLKTFISNKSSFILPLRSSKDSEVILGAEGVGDFRCREGDCVFI